MGWLSDAFFGAAETMPPAQADKYLASRYEELLKWTTTERKGAYDKAMANAIKMQGIAAEGMAAAGKLRQAVNETDQKTRRTQIEASQRAYADVRAQMAALAMNYKTGTEEEWQRAKAMVGPGSLQNAPLARQAAVVNQYAGGRTNAGIVGGEAALYQVVDGNRMIGEGVDVRGLLNAKDAQGNYLLDGPSRAYVADMIKVMDIDESTRDEASQLTKNMKLWADSGRPISAAEAEKAAQLVSDQAATLQATVKTTPEAIGQQAEGQLAANVEYQANLKRLQALESDMTSPEDRHTMYGKVVSDPRFRRWAASNGYKAIGNAEWDRTTDKLTNYVPGRDDRRAVRRYGRQLRRDPVGWEAESKTPLVEQTVDVSTRPENRIQMGQSESDGAMYFKDPDGTITKKLEDGTLVERVDPAVVPKDVKFYVGGVQRSDGSLRFLDEDDVAELDEGNQYAALASDEELVQARQNSDQEREARYGKSKPLTARESFLGPGASAIQTSEGREEFKPIESLAEKVVKPGEHPLMSGKRAERIAERAAGVEKGPVAKWMDKWKGKVKKEEEVLPEVKVDASLPEIGGEVRKREDAGAGFKEQVAEPPVKSEVAKPPAEPKEPEVALSRPAVAGPSLLKDRNIKWNDVDAKDSATGRAVRIGMDQDNGIIYAHDVESGKVTVKGPGTPPSKVTGVDKKSANGLPSEERKNTGTPS